MSLVPEPSTNRMRRASPSEQERLNRLHKKAVECWDAGWNRVDGDYPGQLRRACGDGAFIEVELEVWFYIQGAFFGIGDFTTKEREAGKR